MFKKMLFVFLLAAAVLAFAGYSVPTASACSGSVASCSPIFGQGFETTLTVPGSSAPAPDADMNNYHLGTWKTYDGVATDGIGQTDTVQ
jgi:hypothetical protein